MSLSTVMAADLAAIYDTDEFAVFALHTPVAGASTTVTVIVDASDIAEAQGADELGQTARIRVRAVDVPALGTGDLLTVGDDVWEVLWARLSVDALEWIANVAAR
jgi:hypothetical protein